MTVATTAGRSIVDLQPKISDPRRDKSCIEALFLAFSYNVRSLLVTVAVLLEVMHSEHEATQCESILPVWV